MHTRPLTSPIHPRVRGGAAALTSVWAMRCATGRAGLLPCLVMFLLICQRSIRADDCGARPQDELWLVSARQCCHIVPGEAPELSVDRYDGDSHWQPVDIQDLCHPTTPDQIIVIYIHGNRVPSQLAASQGLDVYRTLTAGVDDATPIRFVIWSWPSAQVRGQLRDVRTKANRTDVAGYCLAWVLTHFPETQHVSLLGYSFGARIATGAMHLVGGGELAGRMLPPHPATSRNTRVVMMAGALHNTWLRPGGYHELATQHLDHLLNLYNCCDPILKRYHRLYKHSHATAIGYAGMYTADLDELAQRIEQQDVCNFVQDSHDVHNYMDSADLAERIRDVLFWRPVRPEAGGGRLQALGDSHFALTPAPPPVIQVTIEPTTTEPWPWHTVSHDRTARVL